jgi:hypothetical protein
MGKPSLTIIVLVSRCMEISLKMNYETREKQLNLTTQEGANYG